MVMVTGPINSDSKIMPIIDSTCLLVWICWGGKLTRWEIYPHGFYLTPKSFTLAGFFLDDFADLESVSDCMVATLDHHFLCLISADSIIKLTTLSGVGRHLLHPPQVAVVHVKNCPYDSVSVRNGNFTT